VLSCKGTRSQSSAYKARWLAVWNKGMCPSCCAGHAAGPAGVWPCGRWFVGNIAQTLQVLFLRLTPYSSLCLLQVNHRSSCVSVCLLLDTLSALLWDVSPQAQCTQLFATNSCSTAAFKHVAVRGRLYRSLICECTLQLLLLLSWMLDKLSLYLFVRCMVLMLKRLPNKGG
jgi:hypothetical protein